MISASGALLFAAANVGALHTGVRRLEMPWIDRFGEAVAGAVIVCIGAFVWFLGI